jgi:N-acetylmuramic acid 6-phosphate etherase
MSTSDDRLLLGLDAGGSSTTAMLARRSTRGWLPLGRGTSGAGNPALVDPSTALDRLDAAIDDAFQQAGRARSRVDSACLAIAGSDRASMRETLLRWIDERSIATDCVIVHDAAPLLAWAPPIETAVALVSGTGSLAWGRDGEGRSARAGGWGPLLGDEGSGYWLGLQSLQAIVREVDRRGPPTSLSRRLPSQLTLTDWKELPVQVQTLSRHQIAALAPQVITAADMGDLVARQLLADAARHLADMVQAVAVQLHAGDSLGRLAIAGGVLLRSPALQQQLTERLDQHGLHIQQVQRVDDPLQGAVELAYQAMLR